MAGNQIARAKAAEERIEEQVKHIEVLKSEKRGLKRERLRAFAYGAAAFGSAAILAFSSAVEFGKYSPYYKRKNASYEHAIASLEQQAKSGNREVIYVIDSQAGYIAFNSATTSPVFPIPSNTITSNAFSSIMSNDFSFNSNVSLAKTEYRVLNSATKGAFAKATIQALVNDSSWGVIGLFEDIGAIIMLGLGGYIASPKVSLVQRKRNLDLNLANAKEELNGLISLAESADDKLDTYQHLIDKNKFGAAKAFAEHNGLDQELIRQAADLERDSDNNRTAELMEKARRLAKE